MTTANRQPLHAMRRFPAAVALGRKGGRNSRINLTPDERTRLARKAAAARWRKAKRKPQPEGE